MFKDFMKNFSESTAKYLAIIVVVVFTLLVLFQLFNPFNFSFIDKAKDFLGINRESASELQEIVAGKLEGRRLLADATREYSGDFIVEKRGGPLNCAGETQFINDGIATARVVVLGEDLRFQDTDDEVLITIPDAQLDTVDLREDLEIVSKRNVCTRFTQLFGDVSSESEIREELRSEVQNFAEKDTDLFKEAVCNAQGQVSELLQNANVDADYKYQDSSGDMLEC